MKSLYIINDLHLSAVRSAGTTPATAWQLRQDLLQGFADLLERCDSDVLINGDFADDYRMIPADMLKAYEVIQAWLIEKGHRLYALPGNHCLSKSSLDLSSFEFLFRLLAGQFPGQVKLMMGPGHVRDGVYAIPHMPNQSLLDLELGRVPAGTSYLALHANYDNHFAMEKDHSLCVSEAQARDLQVDHLVFGHEHVARTELGGKVVIVGNQQCSSISDCLNNATKRMLKITDAGMEFIETWQAEGDFSQIDWRDLQDTGARFIRVTGEATSAEAAAVVTAISRFRSTSTALVISNAVKVEGVNDQEALSLSQEELTAFDVREALRDVLTDDENTKIDNLLKDRHAQAN